MIKLHDLQAAPGAKKRRTRKGRGIAAGKGKTAGRGMKGQNARSGGGVHPYFEGGQLPLVRRIPQKRGFRNRTRVRYVPVNLGTIVGVLQRSDLAGATPIERTRVREITPQFLADAGIIRKATLSGAGPYVVILGDGNLDRPLTVRAHRFSAAATAKIQAAGGQVEVLPLA